VGVATSAASVPFWARGQEPIELLGWFSPFSDLRYAQQYLPWFMQKLRQILPRHVTVSFGAFSYPELQSKFLIQAKTGKPDVIEGLLEQYPIYLKAGLIAPLTARFNAWGDSLLFEKNALDPLTTRGELWGIPYVLNARAMLYRKSLLDKYNLKAPKSWSELLESAALITAKEKGDASGYIITTKRGAARGFQEFLSHLFQLSEHVFVFNTNQRKWEVQVTPDQLTQLFQLYQDFFFAGQPPAVPVNLRGKNGLELDQGYSLGRHALAPNGSFIFGRREEGALQKRIFEEDTGVAPLPIPPRGKPRTYLEVKPIMINQFSKHQDLAFEVIKVFTSAESIARLQALGGDTSPRRDAVLFHEIHLDDQARSWLAQWNDLLPSGVALEPVNWLSTQEKISELIEAVVYKENTGMTASEAAKRLHQLLVEEAGRF
jgi:ABC-type glycerol-3-phosphate transport system substrate-binding protein